MLSAPPLELNFDDDEWVAPATESKLYRAASVGNSWGVTSIGRGFDWEKKHDDHPSPREEETPRIYGQTVVDHDDLQLHLPQRASSAVRPSKIARPITTVTPAPSEAIVRTSSPVHMLTAEPLAIPLDPSRTPSPRPVTPSSVRSAPEHGMRPPPARSPSSPRPRRRSSQQRVSLVAGRVLIAPMEPPSPPPSLPPSLRRSDSQTSFLSAAASAGPPTPSPERDSFLGGRSISEFEIEGDIGRGAYGLVKRARERQPDGSLGPPLVIKQVIKSRILADCWKRHPQYGTIPIEIYVMSAISSISYVLPPRRPWDPHRPSLQDAPQSPVHIPALDDQLTALGDDSWQEGRTVKGHPNICPLLDFFEDNHYYYLVLPSTTPEQEPDEPPPPFDLFDLVESYPTGIPSSSIRSYLGQIADALCFLHAQGIVHRDVKDENVVLGAAGKAILIDFGSSGLVKKNGWDTFSGTLDYAGPEILRGERYHGKEQDVWAFGVVAYVLLVGECPFTTASEAQEGLESPFASASIALDERCGDDKELSGEESDGGGALGDAAALVRACLKVDVAARPTFEKVLQSRFLSGHGGWGMANPFA
ncbi:hypothetical protein PLICRDRAFT_35733 [Plicaturopsis crispa FD-325 SS-3]|nr:hypothetical protein PLICRDRAFT_35733 [Plicaturopsis crispa FD-325 SS-3]